jgi:glycolate oxidase iron-sulfur subunit
MAWVTEQRPTATELAACVQCGLCLPHCPTFRLTGLETASPRGRLAAMNAINDDLIPFDDTFAAAMTFCLNCRACEAVCPSLVPFGRAMEGARAEVTAQLPSGSRRLRHLVLGRVVPSRRLMRTATAAVRMLQQTGAGRWLPRRWSLTFAGVRRITRGRGLTGQVFAPAGIAKGTIGLLRGCVMDPWFPKVHQAVVEVLVAAHYRVIVPRAQTCCGALAAHDGAADAAMRLARHNLAAFAGVDVVVADAAGCSAHLKEYGHWTAGGDDLAARVRDVTEFVADLINAGDLPLSSVDRGPVAVQDPCHLRHAQRIMAAPRQILRAAGYTPVEVDQDGLCCGAAGIYSILEPEASAELGRRKAAQVRSTGSTLVASANPGCEMQLRSHLGEAYRIVHPVELYHEAFIGKGH